MADHKYQIGEIYKAVDAKKIYPKNIELTKKDVHLFLDFYRDFVGVWFDATENVTFSTPVLDDKKQTIADWDTLASELPKYLNQSMTFKADFDQYMTKVIPLGKLISNIKTSLEMATHSAELKGGTELDKVYKRLFAWPNIWAKKEIVPELIGDLQVNEVAQKVINYLENPQKLTEISNNLVKVRGNSGAVEKFANLILKALNL